MIRSLKNLTIALVLCLPATALGWTTDQDAIWITTAHFVPLDAIVSKAVTRHNIERRAICVLHDPSSKIWGYVMDFDTSLNFLNPRFSENAVWMKLTQANGTQTFVDRYGRVYIAGADSLYTMTRESFEELRTFMSTLETKHYDACSCRSPGAPVSEH